jgi:AAA family ATP:ADP antiporter
MAAHGQREGGKHVSPLRRLLLLDRGERAPVLFATAMFFCVLASVFLLRPLRDEMGLRGGARNLRYLWTCTLGGTLLASFAFAAVASRWARRSFLAAAYRAVAVAWIAYLPLVLWTGGEWQVWVARAFYVTHAIVNVLVVSLFWALLADLFGPAQSRRLFGLVAVGGTLGAMAGTEITAAAADARIAPWMIVPAALLLEVAVRVARATARCVETRPGSFSAPGADSRVAAAPLGGDSLEGARLVARSTYLQTIALYTFLFGVLQTFLTYQQNFLLEASHPIHGTVTDAARAAATAARQHYFARAENAAQTLTLFVQLFVTGRLMRAMGVAGALAVLPAVALAGFGALGFAHLAGAGALAVVTVALVAFRGLNHATMRPAREALYVPATREEKYKAKSFTDTFAFRGGDLAGIWSFGALSLAQVAFLAMPLAAVWGAAGIWLGRRQREKARAVEPAPAQM